MRKEEYIRRYGVSAYCEQRERDRINQQRRKLGLPRIRKNKNDAVVNDIDIKMSVVLGDDGDEWRQYQERLDAYDKLSFRLQKSLSGWWGRENGGAKFILIVDAGNKVKGKDLINIKVSLTQLGMDKETQRRFKLGAPEIIRRQMNKEEEEC